jgi:hypothetical protein
MNIAFKENQKLSGWVFALLIPIGLLFAYGIYQQIFLGEPFGTKPAPDTVLIVGSIFIFSLIAFFFALNLETKIDQAGIKIRAFLFIKKEIKWENITKAEVLDYGFIGGWGIRFTQKYGTAYNTKGKIGLALQLKNGKKLLIGTQRGPEIEKILSQTLG